MVLTKYTIGDRVRIITDDTESGANGKLGRVSQVCYDDEPDLYGVMIDGNSDTEYYFSEGELESI